MMDDKPRHPFEILRKDEYAHSIEKKGKFDYLSWAICWDKMKEYDPSARYELVDLIETGQSKLVHVRLTYWDRSQEEHCTHDEYLAVRNYNNKAESNPDAAQVENTFRRAIAKAVSMATGFGLELWINEDIRDLDYVPETIKGKTPVKGGMTVDQAVKLDRLSRNKLLKEDEQAKVNALLKDTSVSEKDTAEKITQLETLISKRRQD
jgi:hypothetical protein|tara:strand:- start:913 stop:1533 length:621 start_codon:yes stop_codon:yes gene_type:complete